MFQLKRRNHLSSCLNSSHLLRPNFLLILNKWQGTYYGRTRPKVGPKFSHSHVKIWPKVDQNLQSNLQRFKLLTVVHRVLALLNWLFKPVSVRITRLQAHIIVFASLSC